MVVDSIRASKAAATAWASAVLVPMASNVPCASAFCVAARWVLDRVGVKVFVGVSVIVAVSVGRDVGVSDGVDVSTASVTSGVSLTRNTIDDPCVDVAVLSPTALSLFPPDKIKNPPTPKTAMSATNISQMAGLVFFFWAYVGG